MKHFFEKVAKQGKSFLRHHPSALFVGMLAVFLLLGYTIFYFEFRPKVPSSPEVDYSSISPSGEKGGRILPASGNTYFYEYQYPYQYQYQYPYPYEYQYQYQYQYQYEYPSPYGYQYEYPTPPYGYQ